MKKIGIFYGSNTGVTEKIAYRIADALGVSDNDVYDVGQTAPSAVGGYDLLVLGTSTWGPGEMADPWADFIDGLEALDLSGKEAALFGVGDESFSDTFCSGVGELHDRLIKTGVKFIAPYDFVGFDFDRSSAVGDNEVEACGLLLDEINHADLTDGRISGWARKVLAG